MSRLATPEGTARYARRLASVCAPGHFRELPAGSGGLLLSSLGLGTYTGPLSAAADAQYRAATAEAVRRGINLIDCAINYRHMRSERAVGAGLRDLVERGEAARDEVFVMTKGGYLPLDGDEPADPGEYLRRTYFESGLIRPGELAGGSHCIAPRYLEDQLGRSLRNLGLEAIDVYFLHNVEQQLEEVPIEEFGRRVEAAFSFLEGAVRDGRIGRYGVATWNGFRVPPEAPGHLSLELLMAAARKAGGAGHAFRTLQLPFNLGMPEALTTPTQAVPGGRVPLLEAAARHGLMVVTSVPLLQTQVLPHIPASFADRMPGLSTAAQRALQFVRSTPGVFAPLVGMRSLPHVQENAVLAAVPPLDPARLMEILGGPA